MANIYDMSDVWADGATTFTSIKMDVTDTASASDSLLMDLQVGGTSQFSVSKDGETLIGATGRVGFASLADGYLSVYSGTSTKTETVRLVNSEVRIGSGKLGFGAGLGTQTTVLQQDAFADTLALRRTTYAQTFNIYNTYTNDTNYERGFMRWNSNVLEIGTEADGTGSDREMKILGSQGQEIFFQDTNGDLALYAGASNRSVFIGHARLPAVTFNNDEIRKYTTGATYTLGNSVYVFSGVYSEANHLSELSADPADPAEGQSVTWQSDGTASGDDGDIMMKITAGGVTKTVTLVDFSAA